MGTSDQSDIGEDDDEEIDSDEAFDSEDERKFGDFDFGKYKRKGRQRSESEDEEDSELEEEEDSEDEARHQEMLANLRKLREEEENGVGDDGVGGAAKSGQGRAVAPKLGDDTMQESLTLTDLVSTWKESEGKTNSRNRKLEKSLKRMTPTAAPLPKIVQERNERKAAYSISSKDVSKWQNIVKANREARTLEFSNRQTKQLQLVSTTAGLADNVKPENDMEKEIAAMLNQELEKDKVEEDLPSNELSKEEMKERQAKLAKMRSVLFYHDQKAKRLKAIKSKRHHKYLKQVEKRKIEKEGIDIDPEIMKKEMEHAEYLRAKERLTLKHKNTSKWAKRALQRGFQRLDDNTKMALSEQNQISEALKRKVNYQEDSEEYSSDEDDDEVDGSGKDTSVQKINNKAKSEVLQLLQEDPDAQIPKKGLFSLPFMARAINKQKEEARQKAEDFLMELENESEEGSGSEEEAAAAKDKSRKGGNGVLSFGSKGDKKQSQQDKDSEDDYSDSDDSENQVLEEEKEDDGAAKSVGKKRKDVALSYGQTVLGTSRVMDESFQGSEVVLPQALSKRAKKSAKTPKEGQPSEKKGDLEESEDEEYLADDSGDETPGLSQREIVSKAFGAFGDDVQTDFQDEKLQNVTDELPTFDEPADLPGWGKWESERKTPKWILKARAKAEEQRKEALALRKDRKLKHVVISERDDKKSSKYTAQDVPYPFQKREDYERSIRTPLGGDFNSDKSHRDLTRPDVLTTTGVRIDPLSYTKSNSNPNRNVGISGVRKV